MSFNQGDFIRKGNDLMLFIKGKSVAFATNHSFSMTTETEEVQTKDSGYDAQMFAKTQKWEITSENLYIDAEYETLFDAMVEKKPVQVVWGIGVQHSEPTTHPDEGHSNANEYEAFYYEADKKFVSYSGLALITSLNVNANAGENATVSITLTGSGSINKVAKS